MMIMIERIGTACVQGPLHKAYCPNLLREWKAWSCETMNRDNNLRTIFSSPLYL